MSRGIADVMTSARGVCRHSRDKRQRGSACRSARVISDDVGKDVRVTILSCRIKSRDVAARRYDGVTIRLR